MDVFWGLLALLDNPYGKKLRGPWVARLLVRIHLPYMWLHAGLSSIPATRVSTGTQLSHTSEHHLEHGIRIEACSHKLMYPPRMRDLKPSPLLKPAQSQLWQGSAASESVEKR